MSLCSILIIVTPKHPVDQYLSDNLDKYLFDKFHVLKRRLVNIHSPGGNLAGKFEP